MIPAISKLPIPSLKANFDDLRFSKNFFIRDVQIILDLCIYFISGLIITNNILKSVVAFNACGTSAGIMIISPAFSM